MDYYYYFTVYLAAPGISCSKWDLVPWPTIEPGSLALEAQSLSHWTTKEVSSGELHYSLYKGGTENSASFPKLTELNGRVGIWILMASFQVFAELMHKEWFRINWTI